MVQVTGNKALANKGTNNDPFDQLSEQTKAAIEYYAVQRALLAVGQERKNGWLRFTALFAVAAIAVGFLVQKNNELTTQLGSTNAALKTAQNLNTTK